MRSTDMRLETSALSKRFGGVVALDGVDVEFPEGSVTAVIGPNGAGKTTLFNVLSGYLKPDTGSVWLIDETASAMRPRLQVSGMSPDAIARHGIGVLFQGVRVFKGLAALENVMVGFRDQSGESVFKCLLPGQGVRREESIFSTRARELLDYVGLSAKAHLWTSQLSYGQQKLVAIARLLATDARVLLLDEPTSGVSPEMVDKVLDLIQRLAADDKRAVVMIEHNLSTVRRIGDWVYLMAGGRVEVFGEPSEVLRDKTLFRTFPTL